jgi:hypothetical protein
MLAILEGSLQTADFAVIDTDRYRASELTATRTGSPLPLHKSI